MDDGDVNLAEHDGHADDDGAHGLERHADGRDFEVEDEHRDLLHVRLSGLGVGMGQVLLQRLHVEQRVIVVEDEAR